MASISLAPAINIENGSSPGPPRHVRKHSRYPTAAAPLPSFSFNPGTPSQEDAQSDDKENVSMIGSGHIRRSSKPAPLPDFSFNPGADLPVENVPSPTHPILEEMALNQQRVSKSAKPAPLPTFTFNPGAASGSSSPTKLEVDGERSAVGHRRGGSEFVGGKADSAQLVMTSPSKQDSKLNGPPVATHGFRGHTHRRSQAVSVSDIDTSDLIKQHALAKARAPSNPSTPQEITFPFPKPSPNHRYTASAARSPPSSPKRGSSMSSYRPRTVDFSEKVQVIPRPLSMISSETERSNSTIRGHSLSNSINSIASPGHSTSAESRLSLSMPSGESMFNRRPNTADASLLLSAIDPTKDENLLSMPKRPLSASNSPMLSTSGSPPLKKKHFWSTYGNESTPTPTPKEERDDPFESVSQDMTVPNESRARPKTAPERPSSHKRRKYHTWTAGIFSKKSKQRSAKKSKRTATPPALLRQDSDKLNDIFDADNTVVLREDSPVATRVQSVTSPCGLSITTSAAFFDGPSQVIDLDAALDPFIDDRRHSDDNARSTTARIAKLHSSERRAVVDAFGVSHRRTESAPALSPVNRPALFGMRSQGSNASLGEEVFDEQEEDNFLAHEEKAKSRSAQHSSEALEPPRFTQSEGGLGLSNLAENADNVIIVDVDVDTEESRSSKSTIEAPVLLIDDLPKRPATSPMAFAYPDTQLHYASSTEGRTTSASLISSPDVENMSFDTQSRHRRFGDHNIDSLRPSTDDLPSLSDSASSHVYARPSGSANARPSLDHRSNSMFVPGSAKVSENWKRSSLASLHRLIPGSSHGSKLKLESTLADGEDKTKKKSNRISKLMRFWRSKEVGGKQDS